MKELIDGKSMQSRAYPDMTDTPNGSTGTECALLGIIDLQNDASITCGVLLRIGEVQP